MSISIDDAKLKCVEEMVYEYPREEVISAISKINDCKTLYVFAFNYNWDNGFEIPNTILESNVCTLETALLMFFRADGVSFLKDKTLNGNLPEWSSFIKRLYDRIIERRFQVGGIKFEAPVSSVQAHTLKKSLNDEEQVFFDSYDGEDLDIEV